MWSIASYKTHQCIWSIKNPRGKGQSVLARFGLRGQQRGDLGPHPHRLCFPLSPRPLPHYRATFSPRAPGRSSLEAAPWPEPPPSSQSQRHYPLPIISLDIPYMLSQSEGHSLHSHLLKRKSKGFLNKQGMTKERGNHSFSNCSTRRVSGQTQLRRYNEVLYPKDS